MHLSFPSSCFSTGFHRNVFAACAFTHINSFQILANTLVMAMQGLHVWTYWAPTCTHMFAHALICLLRTLEQAADAAPLCAPSEIPIYEKRVFRCIRLLTAFLHESEAVLRQNNPGFDLVKHGLRLRGEVITIRVQRVGSQGKCPVIVTYTNSTICQLRLVRCLAVLQPHSRALSCMCRNDFYERTQLTPTHTYEKPTQKQH
jgi:hypothetical protein